MFREVEMNLLQPNEIGAGFLKELNNDND